MKREPGHSWKALRAVGLLLFSALFIPASAWAHPPASVALKYKTGAGTLTVIITHRVSNPERHYVESVRIWKNGTPVGEFSYESQRDKDGVTYTYDIPADNGDVLRVEASCSVFGSRTADLTMTQAAESLREGKDTLAPGK